MTDYEITHGRIRRRLAILATVVAAAGLAGYTGPRPDWCHTPAAPAGTRVQVDVHGNAWTMDTHVGGPVVVMTCAGGAWNVVVGGAR